MYMRRRKQETRALETYPRI
uniref:Uncharacterized protein n=1 Tax=Arundo donax TaxID=35708 RepID=A0A0A9CFJ5_ARUDO